MNSVQFSIKWLGILTIVSSLLLSNTLGLESEEKVSGRLDRAVAMPSLSEDRVGQILERYYKDGLGGPEAWEAVSSMYIDGRLKMKSGEFQLTAYRKKPHYIKRTIVNARHYLEAGYDGKSAWQISSKGDIAREMEPDKKRRFIHDAQFGSYLLYPHIPGKQIEYIDTVPANGNVCHMLRVKLKRGYQVDYFIDVHTHLITKAVNTDLHSGETYSLEYSNYSHEFGIPIAQKIVTYENAKWASTLEVDQIKVNTGMMPWMFEKPD